MSLAAEDVSLKISSMLIVGDRRFDSVKEKLSPVAASGLVSIDVVAEATFPSLVHAGSMTMELSPSTITLNPEVSLLEGETFACLNCFILCLFRVVAFM